MNFNKTFVFSLLGAILRIAIGDKVVTTCPENEELRECFTPWPCVTTCAMPYSIPCAIDPLCAPQCECKEGFVRSKQGGPCITKEECQPYCVGNQEFSSCGRACIVTCGTENQGCTDNCNVGCFCKKGYILDYTTNGECILEKQCPKIPKQ